MIHDVPLQFDDKDPEEAIPLVFDFSDGLATGELLSTFSVSVSVWKGVDANASTVLDSGTQFDLTTTKVYVPVKGGLDSVDYLVRVKCTTTNTKKTLVLTGILPVRNA